MDIPSGQRFKKTMERSVFTGKPRDFDWAIFNSKLLVIARGSVLTLRQVTLLKGDLNFPLPCLLRGLSLG